jgi:uncharacterized protein YbaA (DUF1428 family)
MNPSLNPVIRPPVAGGQAFWPPPVSKTRPTDRRTCTSVTSQELSMPYIDGFVCAVPTASRDAYRKHAENANRALQDYGALDATECWGDDVPDGKVTSFPMAVKRTADETVVFSWVTWPDKATRDAGWEKAMKDPRLDPKKNPMPFDGQRLIYGGFEVLVRV